LSPNTLFLAWKGIHIMFETAVVPDIFESTDPVGVGEASGVFSAGSAQTSAESSPDRTLGEAVARALRATGLPALRGIEVDVSRGVVVLWGRVPTYYQKQLAQATAQKFEGVLRIANGIEVVCGPARVPGR
jgi:osmotically-inducible protein OsmY